MIEIFLLALGFLTYWDSIKNGFVIDDQEGILQYDGKLQGWDFGRFTKWLWYRLFQKEGRRHHFFQVLIHSANGVLLYTFLGTIFPETVALFASILFIIHPINVQSVAWASARHYPLGLFYSLLGLNLIQMNVGFLSTMPLFGVFAQQKSIILGLGIAGYLFMYYLAIHSQFTNLAIFVILAFLGYYPLAILCAVISIVMGAGIIKDTIGHRSKTFKEQNLQEGSKFHHRKFIVMCKTLYYYTKLCLFPKRLGLYHTFNYHYSKEKTEGEDYTFWLGFGLLVGFSWLFFIGSFLVKFGILWYLSFIVIFLNGITIHQFVSERYCYVANIGLCILVASLLVYVPVVMAVVCGIAIMRTWAHLPTFMDEVPFYQSNIWNFPNSEVAFANLGVTYMKRGLVGSAVDMWLIGTNINKEYDVAWYNLSSTLKTKGQLPQAVEYLKKAVASPQCHFKEAWTKELADLEHEMGYLKELNELGAQLSDMSKDPKNIPMVKGLESKITQLHQLQNNIKKEREGKLVLLQQQQSGLEVKRIELEKIKEQLEKVIDIKELVKIRDMQWKLIKEDALRQIKGVTNETTGGGIHQTG